MVNVGYHTARILGNMNRSIYRAMLPQIVKIPINQTRRVSLSIYSFSCQRDLPEQVASIRSFIRYVGIPESFIVISDASYTEESCDLISQINPCVKVVSLERFVKPDLSQSVYQYASKHPLGKKLSALLSIPSSGINIYTDSDILFFPEVSDLIALANSEDKSARYLLDCNINKLDDRIIYNDSEKLNPVNSGFMLFKQELDWSFALERLSKLTQFTHYFTEQTIVHLTMHHNHALPFCSDKYVVKNEDQFVYSDKFASQSIALRHYVSDVRYKFWFNVKI